LRVGKRSINSARSALRESKEENNGSEVMGTAAIIGTIL
jgi:hypothetical protein